MCFPVNFAKFLANNTFFTENYWTTAPGKDLNRWDHVGRKLFNTMIHLYLDCM